jgi:hypothetical protein
MRLPLLQKLTMNLFTLPARRLLGSSDVKESLPKRVIDMGITNETCRGTGLYLSTGACGHSGYQMVTKGQQFATCGVCGEAVNWTFRETYSPILFRNLKGDAVGT